MSENGSGPGMPRAREALRAAGLAEYLVRAILVTLPPEATTEVVESLIKCLKIWRERARAKPADWRVATDLTAPESELVTVWQRAGGRVADLDKIREMLSYRQVRQDQVWSYGPTAVTQQAAEQIRSFWVTSGHDLAALDDFFTNVDAEFPDALPG